MRVADEVAAAVLIMSRHRIGAILLWDPAVAIEGGTVFEAKMSRELLVAIFVPEYVNRLLHRGAAIIRDGRIERAGVPVSWATVVGRAAELAAGVAVAVDEDRGGIRIVDRTGRIEVVGVDELASVLRRHVALQRTRLRSPPR
jgi:hypothetical protein